jgi:ubiquinone/menaquinone biosynthesis C-methylase UbiE
MEGKSHLRFARLAPFYDLGVRLCGLSLGGERRVREKVLDLLPLHKGDRVLEIGCGTGTVTLMAAHRVGETGEAVGIDPSPEMLTRARAKLAAAPLPHVSFLESGGSHLPFPANHFDAVILFLVLHEMAHSDRLASLSETLRLLRPGGHVVIGELHRPVSLAGRLLLRSLLVVEEAEARDFLDRGLPAILAEGVGNRLREVSNIVFAGGLAQGVVLRLEEEAQH